MDYENIQQQWRLIALLAEGRLLKVSEIVERLGLNRRSVYRYLELLPSMGMLVERRGVRYRLDPASPFLEGITEHLRFMPEEIALLHDVLQKVGEASPQLRRLRDKVARLHRGDVLEAHELSEQLAHNMRNIYEAIRQGRVALLKGYASASSPQPTDRIVEPFAFLPGNREVRCFEAASMMNKTFNLARVAEVVVLDLNWDHRERHRPIFTDLFHFSGEESERITLRLGQLSKHLLLEEVPAAEPYLTAQSDNTWLLQADFCSFKGVGRFVLGLLDDIEVVDSPAFAAYLRERIAQYGMRLQ